jgi:hypothetical protein
MECSETTWFRNDEIAIFRKCFYRDHPAWIPNSRPGQEPLSCRRIVSQNFEIDAGHNFVVNRRRFGPPLRSLPRDLALAERDPKRTF